MAIYNDTTVKQEKGAFEKSVKSVNYQLKVIWYHWTLPDKDGGSLATKTNLAKINGAQGYDITDFVTNCRFSKGMSEGSGTFSFTLQNSHDWSRLMKPGTWCAIYMSNEGGLDAKSEQPSGPPAVDPMVAEFGLSDFDVVTPTPPSGSSLPLPKAPKQEHFDAIQKYLRTICFIQRVGIRTTTASSTGEVDISYQITGKDFGVCLDESELWFNLITDMAKTDFHTITKSDLNIKKGDRNLHKLLSIWMDAFLLLKNLLKTSQTALNYWIMPDKLLENLNIKTTGGAYFGEIQGLKAFSKTIFENNLANPLNGAEGMAWDKLKSLSQPEFHELFTELSDLGLPRVYFRPIPWGIDRKRYSILQDTFPSYLTFINSTGISATTPTFDDISTSGFAALGANFIDTTLLSEARVNRVNIGQLDIIEADVGPDFHMRYNQFIVSPTTDNNSLKNALGIITANQNPLRPFPYRNDESVMKYGFKPKHLQVNCWLQNTDIPGKTPDHDFLLAMNEVALDLWGHQKDFYSGALILRGMSEIRLGKVLVTNKNVHGISDMALYIEGYTDDFTIDANGTTDWVQTVLVTRGIEMIDLETKTGFTKKEPVKHIDTFVKKAKNNG